MSNADRLKDYLSDFKKSASNSTSISITSGDDDSTASLLGGISSWSKTGFSSLKKSMSKVQDTLPTSVKVETNPKKNENQSFWNFMIYYFLEFDRRRRRIMVCSG